MCGTVPLRCFSFSFARISRSFSFFSFRSFFSRFAFFSSSASDVGVPLFVGVPPPRPLRPGGEAEGGDAGNCAVSIASAGLGAAETAAERAIGEVGGEDIGSSTIGVSVEPRARDVTLRRMHVTN